jgi:hypothetical protein
MGNPAVMLCLDCKDYFEIGCVAEEEWSKNHLPHHTTICPQTCVSVFLSEFEDTSLKKRLTPADFLAEAVRRLSKALRGF